MQRLRAGEVAAAGAKTLHRCVGATWCEATVNCPQAVQFDSSVHRLYTTVLRTQALPDAASLPPRCALRRLRAAAPLSAAMGLGLPRVLGLTASPVQGGTNSVMVQRLAGLSDALGARLVVPQRHRLEEGHFAKADTELRVVSHNEFDLQAVESACGSSGEDGGEDGEGRVRVGSP